MEFRGIDWTELSISFGLADKAPVDITEEEDLLEKTKEFLKSVMFTEQNQNIANSVRFFLKRLYDNSKDVKESAPIWKGLLDVEDDFTLIKYSVVLLEFMWF